MNTDFPKITTTVHANPLSAVHVAHIISTRIAPTKPRAKRVIESYIVPDKCLN